MKNRFCHAVRRNSRATGDILRYLVNRSAIKCNNFRIFIIYLNIYNLFKYLNKL